MGASLFLEVPVTKADAPSVPDLCQTCQRNLPAPETCAKQTLMIRLYGTELDGFECGLFIPIKPTAKEKTS